jgi:hypothetical protein
MPRFNLISLSHEGRNPPFQLGVLSALVKDSKQVKQREKRFLKVVTVNLSLYKQLITTTLNVVRRLSNVGEAVSQKWRKNRP